MRCVHSFVDATSRARLETIERRRRGKTNERTNERTDAFVVVAVVVETGRDETRPRVIHARVKSVSGKSIHWPRETEKSTREDSFIHSFIHSVRFGSVTRATEPPRLSIVRCRRYRSRRRGRRETMDARTTMDAGIGRRDARGRRAETRLGTDWRLERPIPIDEVAFERAIDSCRRERRAWGFEGGSVCWKRRAGRERERARETRRRAEAATAATAATREGRRARARRTIRDAGETWMMMDGG